MNDLQAMRQDPRFEVYKAQAETNWVKKTSCRRGAGQS
jgi:hypothetical protein